MVPGGCAEITGGKGSLYFAIRKRKDEDILNANIRMVNKLIQMKSEIRAEDQLKDYEFFTKYKTFKKDYDIMNIIQNKKSKFKLPNVKIIDRDLE